MTLTENNVNELIVSKASIKQRYWLFYGSNYGLGYVIVRNVIKHISADEDIAIECSNLAEDDVLSHLQELIYGSELFYTTKAVKLFNPTKKVMLFIQNCIKQQIHLTNCYIFVLADDSVNSKSSIKAIFQDNPMCACVACYEDDKIKLGKIANDYLSKTGLNIAARDLIDLLDCVKHDRLLLLNELEKLCFLPTNAGMHEVSQLFASDLQELNFSAFCDNFVLGNKTEAISEFNKLFKLYDINIIQIVRIALDHISKLLNIKNDVKLGKVTVDVVMKIYGIFFQRIPIVKRQLAIDDTILIDLISSLNNIEIMAKTLGEDIAIAMLHQVIISLRYIK